MPKPGTNQAYLAITVRDRCGRTVLHRRMRSRSYVRNFLRTVGAMIGGSGWIVNDKNGLAYNFNNLIGNLASSVADIAIGSGTTAASVSDYALATEITSGDASLVTDNSAGGTIAYTFTWTATNNSGVSWSVNETGLFVDLYITTTSWITVMILRDVLSATVTVLDGQAITVSYTLQTTV